MVEDLEYHLRLVDAGIRVEFLENATVSERDAAELGCAPRPSAPAGRAAVCAWLVSGCFACCAGPSAAGPFCWSRRLSWHVSRWPAKWFCSHLPAAPRSPGCASTLLAGFRHHPGACGRRPQPKAMAGGAPHVRFSCASLHLLEAEHAASHRWPRRGVMRRGCARAREAASVLTCDPSPPSTADQRPVKDVSVGGRVVAGSGKGRRR